MIKDYAGNFIAGNGNCKKKTVKRKKLADSKSILSLTELMWKTIGAMLLVTMVIGVSSTFWYGWQIQSALDEIGKSKVSNKELTNTNLKLSTHRDILLSKEHIIKTAKKLGLYKDTNKALT
jgi:cell division protein FtsL